MGATAFFDLDNTVVRGSSMFFLARQLIAEGIVSRREVARFALMEARFRLTKRENSGDRESVTATALALVQGKPVGEVDALCRRAAGRLLHKRLMATTLRRLREHQERGEETWLVTASPIEMARVVAELLGMTGAIATTPQIEHGVYTGRLDGPPMHGARKAETVLRIAAERGIDLEESCAYSDSQNDVPMLSLVGTAVVVNATCKFQRLARNRGWYVLDDARARSLAFVPVLRRLRGRYPQPEWVHVALAEARGLAASTALA